LCIAVYSSPFVVKEKELNENEYHKLLTFEHSLQEIDPNLDPRVTLKMALPGLVQGLAAYFDTGMSVSIYQEAWDEPVTAVGGYDDVLSKTPMTPQTVIPSGSVTKSFTVSTILKFVDEGKIQLDEVVHPYVDRFLTKINGTTLMDLWKDPRIKEVTFKMLAGMRSGLHDYNDTIISHISLVDRQDVTPLDYIWMVDKTFWCDPGTCTSYSTVGMMLLGFAMADITNATTWEDFDQTQIFPRPYENTYFPPKGPCSAYPNMGHQYIVYPVSPYQYSVADIYTFPCSNSWTGGNIAATAGDLSMWWTDLFNDRPFKNQKLLSMMTEWTFFDYYFAVGSAYGLGLEGSDIVNFTHPNTSAWWFFPGHGGADYGSWGIGGWNKQFNFGFHVQMNSNMGKNFSFPDFKLNYYAGSTLWCYVFNTALQVFSKQTLPQLPCIH